MPKSSEASDSCQTEACALQACLNKNTYNPEKCDDHLKKLYRCCQQMYDKRGGKGESTACPMPSVVRRWLTDHPEKPS